ncbi:hypothetical protein KC207_11870 [Phycicoccus sp. BSK3Z-2]|uniref:Uncharacterized protein n=1 Tax=Phycicoccus avicenniae TaxID=2828860 RepID=A0A941DBK6_9MICO|nr:hypothetical protein [Phycicoccus avicenniae]MBR7743987.1 hypothetical protein [Phycicoccus avicenniae]
MPTRHRTVDLVHLPVRSTATDWVYGSAVVPVPGTAAVAVSPPTGASRAPWCLVDVDTGEVRTGTGLPGMLRDLHVPPAGAADPRWWVLGEHGVGRVDQEDPRLAVTDVRRRGVVPVPAQALVPLGPDLVGVRGGAAGTTVVLDARSGEPGGRLRTAGIGAAFPLADGRVRLFEPSRGRAVDVDLPTLRTVRRHALPLGKHPVLAPGTLTYVGLAEVPSSSLGGIGEDPVAVPDAVVRLDPLTLRTLDGPRVPVARDVVEVLGTDSTGRLVVSGRTGLDLADPSTGRVERLHTERPWSAAVLPGRDVAVLTTDRSPLGTLAVVRW